MRGLGSFYLKPLKSTLRQLQELVQTRRGFRPRAVRNNLYCNPTNGSRSAKIHPGQPQRTDSHGSDNPRCLSRGELKILGALPKPEKDLLRPAAA